MSDITGASTSRTALPDESPKLGAPLPNPVVALLNALGDFAALDEESPVVTLVTVQANDTLAIPGIVELGSAATSILAALVADATALAALYKAGVR